LRPTRDLAFAALSLFAAACADNPAPGTLCTPGAQQCEANLYQVCADDGARWVTAQDCSAEGQVCLANRGCLACFPDQFSCGGDGFDVQRCRGDGSAADTITRCDPEIGEICAAGACVNACQRAAEVKSYEGCDYWAVDLDNAVVSNQESAAAQQFAIVVSNPLELPATVTVEVNDAPPGMPPVLRTVAEAHLARVQGGGDLATINLPPREVDGTSDPRLNDGSGTWLSSNAYHVRSTAPIVAYQFNPLENVGVFSNDASLLLPTKALGDQYLVLGWPQTLALTNDPYTNGTIDLRTFVTIVGTEPDTHVSFQSTSATLAGGPFAALLPNESTSAVIGPYDVLNFESDGFNSDFTGSLIIADKPVAVFSGGEASDVPFFDTWLERDCCADHLEEQLFPEKSFGTQFVAVKTPLRTRYVDGAGWDVALVPDEPEYWRILATHEDTVVRTNLPQPNDAFPMQRGQVVTFRTERDFVVDASYPVSFGQFPASQQTTGIPPVLSPTGGSPMSGRPPGGDPSFIVVPPVQQWREKYVFLVPNKYAFDFLLLAVPKGTTLLYDGLDLATTLDRCEYEPIGMLMVGQNESQEYVALRCPLSDPIATDPGNPIYQDDGRHVLESQDGKPFGLVVWGWDAYVSYGYPGGTNLDEINPF